MIRIQGCGGGGAGGYGVRVTDLAGGGDMVRGAV